MDRLIYTAMTGASAASSRQAVLAHNLANASTQGFRAEMTAFRAVPVQGEGLASRVMAAETTTGHSEAAGTPQPTGRALDVMALGRAWLTVQATDGTEAYTRAGALQVSPDGTLVTASGRPVLTDGGAPLTVPPNSEVSIGQDGTVTAKAPGQPSTSLGRLKLVSTSDEQRVQRSADGLMRAANGDSLPADPQARLQSGALESSNVNPVETLVAMIAAARQFESQLRLMQGAEANDKSAAQLLSLQG